MDGYIAETDEYGNETFFYHPVCYAIAKKLDLEMRDRDEVVVKIVKGEVMIPKGG